MSVPIVLCTSVHRDIRSGTRSLTQTQEDVLAVAIAGLRASTIFRVFSSIVLTLSFCSAGMQ